MYMAPDSGVNPVEIARTIAQTIAHPTSHSMKHLPEFGDPRFGTPLNIQTPEALQNLALDIMTSPETRVILTRDTVTYMLHEPTQTCINLRVQGRLGGDGGTIYKFDPQRYASETEWISKAVAKEAERMGVQSFPEQKGGFLKLLQENPETALLFEQRYRERLVAKQIITQNASPAPSPAAAETTPDQAKPVIESKPVANVEAPAPVPPPENGPAKTTQASRFIPEAPPVETVPSTVRTAGVGNTGAASVGIVLGVKGLHDAIETGDTTGGAIAATNIATSTAQATEGVLTAAGRTAPLLTKAGKFIPVVNVGVTLIDGAYQITKEDTPEHMAERTTVVAATATTAIALGTATATAAEAGVITAGVTGLLGTGAAATGTAAVVVAAAPVVLTVAAVGAVAYTGEKAIEAKRAWDDVDRTIAENGAATKRRGYKADDGKPSVLGYKHIAVMMLQHSEHMKNGNMNGTDSLERNQQGRFKIEDFKKIDMRDPKNIAELERVLKESIAREDKIIKDNDSILPRWIRSSDSADKMTMAQMERADLVGAMQELDMYKNELKAWDATHPDDPATTPAAGAPQKPKPNSRAPS
jgi:hypothetical protein